MALLSPRVRLTVNLDSMVPEWYYRLNLWPHTYQARVLPTEPQPSLHSLSWDDKIARDDNDFSVRLERIRAGDMYGSEHWLVF